MRRDRLALVLAALALTACGDEAETGEPAPTSAATEAVTAAPEQTPPPQSSSGASPAVNSLTVDPGDGTLMIGTGPSLYRVEPGTKEAERLTGKLSTPAGEGEVSGNLVVRYASPGDLLASGHPVEEGALPENLGLIRSRDQGETWDSVSTLGEADYHELEVVGDVILAVNVESPDIEVSRDGGRSWEKRTPPAPPIDVVVDPGDTEHWAVSTEQGTFVSTDGGGSWRPRDPASGARLIWPSTDALYSVDRNGMIRVSNDGGRGWEPLGDVGGLPSAAASGRNDELYVAVVGGKVRRSRDGRRWETVATLK